MTTTSVASQDHVPVPDKAVGQAALAKISSRLGDLAKDQLIPPRANVGDASRGVIGVARRVMTPALHARFAGLPPKEFDLANVDTLETVAVATWYASESAPVSTAVGSGVKLPAELVARGTDLKERMIKVSKYYLGADRIAGPEIASIRAGTGYDDLESDLARLARLYRAYPERLQADVTFYDPADADEADEVWRTMLDAHQAGGSPEQQRQRDLLTRAWTLLCQVYGEVAATGSWLERHEGGAALYPSLWTMGRAGRPRKARPAPPAPPAGGGQPPPA